MERSPSLPDVPTIEESGVRGVDVTIWLGMWGPGNLPSDLVNRLNTDLVAALKSSKVRELFAAQDAQPVGSTPAEFAMRVREELARWRKVVQAANIRGE
jgi:tripartite-type tricarboxylate transporter receptor subunit TctC